MIDCAHSPRAPLSGFVELMWYQQREATSPRVEAALPEGTVELVFDLENRDRPGVVIGPHSRPFAIHVHQRQCVLGVHFKPGGVAPFLNLPADELHNQAVSAQDIWGSTARTLRDSLNDANSIPAMFNLVERFLRMHLSSPLLHPAVSFGIGQLYRPAAMSSISGIVDAVGLSERHFAQVFREQVGLRPKMFARVRRFQQVLRQVNTTPHVDWADMAARRGYADQAHLIHEFRDLAGLSPTDYLSKRDGRLNHFVLQR
jgi:AraC-like DNA-binding protein